MAERLISLKLLKWSNGKVRFFWLLTEQEFYRYVPKNFNFVYLLLVYLTDSESFTCMFDVYLYLVHFGIFLGLNSIRHLFAEYTRKVLSVKFS